MFVSVLFLYLDWHERVYKYARPQSGLYLRAKWASRIFKLYRSSNHWAKLGRENCPHRFFVYFRGANNKFQAIMSKSGDNSTLKIVNCASVRSCSANLTPL